MNDELTQFLRDNNYTNEDVKVIEKSKRVNETNYQDVKSNIWTKNALDFVENQEKFVFKVLSDLGIHYSKPNN